MMTITLTLEEYENFRCVAEKFNVKFDVKPIRDNLYMVKAPEDKLLEWGYINEGQN